MTGISRRDWIGGVSALAGTSLLPRGLAAAEPGGRPPNILFILADDLGYADLGCYGARGHRTPVLDRLAQQGVRLTQAYASAPVCSATRTALITGRYQGRLPVGLEEPVPEYRKTLGLPLSHPTLPSLLKRAGYRTALTGKWHLGAPPEFGPTKSGYDHFFGFYQGALDYFAHDQRDPTNKEPYGGLYEDEQAVTREGYLTDLFADDTVRRIEQAGAEPFLLSLHFNAPHWPWERPEDAARSAALHKLRDYAGGSLAIYGAMVAAMDAAIGRVLAALDRTGAAANTIVVFTSDNGGERYSDPWPFIGMKGELLEGGIRVPAIVRWPGMIPAGSTSAQVMVTHDWLPTLVAAGGGAVDPAYPSDGTDIMPQLRGGGVAPRRIFWRYKANDQAAVRDGDLKYLRIGKKEHLFDLAADVHERADLATQRKLDVERLRAANKAWAATMLPYPHKSFSETPKGRLVDRY